MFMGKSKEKLQNEMKVVLPALSVNEGVARAIVGAFVSQADPTLEELADIRCSLSEAVTNAIVHGYRLAGGLIYISVGITEGRTVLITVRDRGCGIGDIAEARKPLFTTDRTGERSGMGFTVMENFCDCVNVSSAVGRGTRVTLKKKLSARLSYDKNRQ